MGSTTDTAESTSPEPISPEPNEPKQAERPARKYHSPRRAQQANRTRAAILASAHELFVTRGYAVTTVADIARHARVAVDTVYTILGPKPAVLRQVVESALSGTDHAIPGPERDYAQHVRAAATARAKIEAYVRGLVGLQPRLAPIYVTIRDAGIVDSDAAALWADISGRRARNMLQFAADLRGTGELRDDLTDREVADIVWSMNGPEYWTLLVTERGWSHRRFGEHLVDTWCRVLLGVRTEEQPH